MVQLTVGREVLLAVLAAEGLLLAAVSGLVLAECHGGGEALLTVVAGKNGIFLLQISFVLVPVGIPHVSLFRPGVAEGDQALSTLQTLVQTLLTALHGVDLRLRLDPLRPAADDHSFDPQLFHAFLVSGGSQDYCNDAQHDNETVRTNALVVVLTG